MVLHIDVFSHHLGKSSLPDFSLPKVGCMFCAGCLDFPYRLQSTGHLWAAHHMCCTGIAALSKSVLSFSFDCVGNVDNLYSLGQGRLIAVKLIFKLVVPACGNWQVPNQPKGKLCVCCWEEQNWDLHWVSEGFRSLFACSQNIWLGNESIKAWDKICPCYWPNTLKVKIK